MALDPALIAFAHQLADAAAAAIIPYFGAHGTVETKGDASPVTAADRAAEQAMRTLIEAHYPSHGIYGEEFGATGGAGSSGKPSPLAGEGLDEGAASKADTRHAPSPNPLPQGERASPASPLMPHYTWVLDPIDGTRNFIAGGTEWGTLIALCEGETPILGILHQPITGERWVGVRGQQTRYYEPSTAPQGQPLPWERSKMPFAFSGEGLPIHTRPCPLLAAAHISTTSRAYFTPPQAVAFARLAEQCGQVIEGGDCVAYGLLARGQRDIVVDAGLKPYDILALVPIIEGAGGRITTWNGGPVSLNDYKNVLAWGDAALTSVTL